MAFIPPGCVLRGFRAATYKKYVSPQTLVRPCPPKKILIDELETPFCANLILPNRGRALINDKILLYNNIFSADVKRSAAGSRSGQFDSKKS